MLSLSVLPDQVLQLLYSFLQNLFDQSLDPFHPIRIFASSSARRESGHQVMQGFAPVGGCQDQVNDSRDYY
jgi:hypothetical protein